MFTTGEIVALAERIIHDTCVVFITLEMIEAIKWEDLQQ